VITATAPLRIKARSRTLGRIAAGVAGVAGDAAGAEPVGVVGPELPAAPIRASRTRNAADPATGLAAARVRSGVTA
jgi:hypothetical protein